MRCTGVVDPSRTVVYDATGTIDIDGVKLVQGSFILKTLVLSIDPYLRLKVI
jgi:hypothetical protein